MVKQKTRLKDEDAAYIPKDDPCQVDPEDRKKKGRLGAIERNLMSEENDDPYKIPRVNYRHRKDKGKPRKKKRYATKAESSKAWRERMKSQVVYPTNGMLEVRKEIERSLRVVWDNAILTHVESLNRSSEG